MKTRWIARSAIGGRLAALVLVAAALSGCGCRPAWVGPYGGIHPGRCWVG